MLYAAYQAQSDLMAPFRLASSVMADAIPHLPRSLSDLPLVRRTAATAELVSLWGLSHSRPAFGIDSALVGGEEVAVTERAAHVTPFGTLLHFAKDSDVAQPPVLLVAPMSGHFSTLLRATVRTMLPEHDVYLTDWHNAREVPVSAGAFGLDGYTDHLIEFLRVIGPGAHMIAVCQPCVQALAATALMAEDDDPARPRSLTLMAGPVDGRINPTEVNCLAVEHPLEWFEGNVISTVPMRFRGAGRRVYPGFVQLWAFMSMSPERHVTAFAGMWDDVARGDLVKADADARLLRGVLRGPRPDCRVLPRDDRQGLPALPARQGRAGDQRPAHRPRRDPRRRAAHRRGRAGQHLRDRADLGRARAVHVAAPEAAT